MRNFCFTELKFRQHQNPRSRIHRIIYYSKVLIDHVSLIHLYHMIYYYHLTLPFYVE